MPDQPTAEAPLSFGSDIQPLFREHDRTAMLRAFDLWSRDDQVSTLERWLGDGGAP